MSEENVKVSKNCAVCDESFLIYPYLFESRKFCGQGCYKQHRKDSIIEKTCEICSSSFMTSSWYLSNGGGIYCGAVCQGKAKHLIRHRYEEGVLVEKQCNECENWLSPSMFSKNKNSKSGLKHKCRSCTEKNRKIRKYNLTNEELENLPRQCEICGSVDNLHIDHCHDTGLVRGVLCIGCNTTLGRYNEDPAIILKLYDYAIRARSIKA